MEEKKPAISRRRNTLTAVLFLLFLAAGVLLIGASTLKDGFLRKELSTLRQDLSAIPIFLENGAEAAVNQDLDRSHIFIQLFGGVQRLSGRRVVEDISGGYNVARLSNGTLNFVTLAQQQEDYAGNARKMATLQQSFAEVGIPSVFVLAPQKIQQNTNPLPVGVHNTANEGADEFLDILQQQGTDSIDLRPLYETGGKYASYFFRTDHHWTPEAAFMAWGYLAPTLAQKYQLNTVSAFTAPEYWEKTVKKDFFLGSQGKRVGTFYAGLDDITIFTPKFDTDFTYTCLAYEIDRSGTFEQSVCFPERIQKRDLFGENPYAYYAGGDYPLATIINHKNPDGAKIVLIRESFACALTPFLALSCSELITIDLRYFEADLMQTIQDIQPDLVMTLYNVGSCASEAMFAFD